MELFRRSMPDPHWLARAGPLLQTAQAAKARLADSLHSDFLEERRQALHEGMVQFSGLLEAVDGMADPTSAGGRSARDQFRSALVGLVEGCRRGSLVLERAAMEIERLRRKGLRGRPRPSRIFTLFSDDPDAWELEVEQAAGCVDELMSTAAAVDPAEARPAAS